VARRPMAELDSFRLHPGDPAPDFALPGVDGATHRLADFSGQKLLLVVFWCNHCPYVQAWEPRMLDLARRYGPKGVAVALINSNDAVAYPDDDMEAMARRAREKGYTVPYLRDESQDIARAYGALVTPHPMLFGPDRRLLYQGRIDDDHQHPERVHHKYLETALEQALAGKAVSPSGLPVAGCTVKWKG
jgi:peroxiredoxin